MTPNELRALADALTWVQYTADWQACHSAADYLRACADAQPVAWMHIDGRVISAATMDQAYRDGGAMQSSLRDYTIPLYAHPAPVAPAGWKLVPVEPTPEMMSAVGMMDGYDWHAPGCSPDADHANWYSAMIAAAPAAPQADAQPVPAGWKLVPVEPTQAMNNAGLSAVNQYGKRLVWETYKAMLAAAPPAEPSAALIRAHNSGYMQGHQDTVEAQFIVIHPLDMNTYHADVVAELGLTAAPQAEPCIGNDSACPCQDGDACHYKDAADGTKAWPVPQAEPKRKPACLWSRADDDTDVWETRCGHAFMIIDGTPGDNHMEFCCYCGRPLEQEIGDSDAE